MIAIAFANATIRELIFIRQFNTLRAHQLSTITLIILCSIYIYFVFPYLRIYSGRQALLIGLLWVILTTLFEFGLGRITKKPWSELLEQYDLSAGQIWPIFLLALLILPYLYWLIMRDREL
jgi:hypothetical protein